MQEILNGMLQAQAAAQATRKLTLWQENFAKVCEGRGLNVTVNGDIMTVENLTGPGVDMQTLCKEATNMTYPQGDFKLEAPMGREAWDKAVDEREDRREEDADKAWLRAKILEMLKLARKHSIANHDFLSAITFEAVRVAIEKDLI